MFKLHEVSKAFGTPPNIHLQTGPLNGLSSSAQGGCRLQLLEDISGNLSRGFRLSPERRNAERELHSSDEASSCLRPLRELRPN